MDSNLQKYMAFIKAAEYKSFTRAAELLHYSQSGISRMISDLEQEWGMQLLDRRRGTVELTSDGLSVFPQVKALCSEYEKLQMQIDARNGLQSGLIRIGAFSSVATHWLPRMISAFHDDYPRIQYEVLMGNYAEIERWIQSGRVDCGFVHLPIHSQLDTILLHEDQLVAAVPPDHPLAQKQSVTVSDLTEDPFLLLECGDTSEVTRLFEQYHMAPNICCTTWDDNAALSMVEEGLCITALPELALTRAPYHVAIRPIEPPFYRSICFALKSRKSASIAVKTFMEYLDCRDSV